jgi:hypothetical protein
MQQKQAKKQLVDGGNNTTDKSNSSATEAKQDNGQRGYSSGHPNPRNLPNNFSNLSEKSSIMGDYGGTHTNINGSNQNKKSRHNTIVQEMYHASESSTGYNNPSANKGVQNYFNTRNQQQGVQPQTLQIGNPPSEFRNGQSV